MQEESKKIEMHKNTVLIIDDDDNITKIFAFMMVKSGMKTYQVFDGYAACKWLEKNKPDLVLCDILMPDMNGMDVLTYIKKLEHMQEVPVLAVTALAASCYKYQILNHGFDAYIPKPVNTSNFAEEIKKYIRGS